MEHMLAVTINGSINHVPTNENRLRCEELASEISLLSGHLNAANYRLLKLIGEFDTRKGWSNEGAQSCAHWLNWKCGIGMNAAREKVRVAAALEQSPKIAAAMERGQLSYCKARELTRIASADIEDALLELAIHGTGSHVQKMVQLYRRAKDAEELTREQHQQETRSVTYRWDDDGSLVLSARLPAEAGVLLLKALNVAADEIPLDEEAAAKRAALEKVTAVTSTMKFPPSHKQRADALALLAESFIAHGSESLSGGDKHQIVVHVSAETLQDSVAGQCEFEDGASMAAETARRLCCDASVVAIVENDKGEPLNVGRKTRSIPPALKRALNSRDQGCRFPGCCNKKFVDGHHVEHWAHGGETKLSNLVTLCRFHHHLVHEGGVTIRILDDGAFRFVKPDCSSIDSHCPQTQGRSSALFAQHEDIRIDEKTAVTLWDGKRCDYELGVWVLMQRGRGKSAGTSVGGKG
jgi:Domain of unknown function (DUF222)